MITKPCLFNMCFTCIPTVKLKKILLLCEMLKQVTVIDRKGLYHRRQRHKALL